MSAVEVDGSSRINNRDINDLLRDIITENPHWQPREIAALALHRIAPRDRDDALAVLLENQVTKVYALDRKPVPIRSWRYDPHYPGWAERPPSNSIAAVRDHVPPIDPKTIGVGAPMAHRIWAKTKLEGVSQKKARELIYEEDRARIERQHEKFRIAIAEMAEIQRKADIAEALNRRLKVRGEHKMLLDCTLEEVEWLAKRATNTAIAVAETAAFYLDIANRMKESGAHIVRDIA